MTKFSSLEYKRPDFDSISDNFTELIERFQQADSAEDQSKVLDEINVLRN